MPRKVRQFKDAPCLWCDGTGRRQFIGPFRYKSCTVCGGSGTVERGALSPGRWRVYFFDAGRNKYEWAYTVHAPTEHEAIKNAQRQFIVCRAKLRINPKGETGAEKMFRNINHNLALAEKESV